ncbi:MAG: hypothetical protein IJ217_05960 [Clostridia bacterium]|nr:hypothetical protein [Clostridia bacterium]
MWVVLGITVGVIFVNYFLGAKLYQRPRNDAYRHNVGNINTIKMPEIAPDPQYILLLTFFTGILIGLFIALVNKSGNSYLYSVVFSVIIGVLYWIEISRRVKITEYSLVLSKALAKSIEIPLNEILGIYIYSPHKKFMDGHMLTTKLVVVTRDKETKFTISSLNKKAVLNIIKNNFGVTDYKIFIANK